MENKHTPGKWHAYEHLDGWRIISDDNIEIAAKMNNGFDMGASDAKRIVDCVNALDGIDDPVEWIKRSRKLAKEYNEQEIKISNLQRIYKPKTYNHLGFDFFVEYAQVENAYLSPKNVLISINFMDGKTCVFKHLSLDNKLIDNIYNLHAYNFQKRFESLYELVQSEIDNKILNFIESNK